LLVADAKIELIDLFESKGKRRWHFYFLYFLWQVLFFGTE